MKDKNNNTQHEKIITTAITLLFIGHEAIHAQNIQPCNTYHMQEYYAKTISGYAEKLQAITQQTEADFLNHLNGLASQKTGSLSPSYTFTIPVVFHILHTNGPENISDATCVAALAQVNSDYARLGSDTNTIDPLFKSLYLNSKMHFQLAQKILTEIVLLASYIITTQILFGIKTTHFTIINIPSLKFQAHGFHPNT